MVPNIDIVQWDQNYKPEIIQDMEHIVNPTHRTENQHNPF